MVIDRRSSTIWSRAFWLVTRKMSWCLPARPELVRGGRSLTIVDRNTPVARLVPFESNAPLEIRKASRKPSEMRLPRAPAAPTDSLSELLRDRSRR